MPRIPSPKFQLIAYGDVPPVVVAVNVTGVFTVGFEGRNVKLVASRGGVPIITVAELLAV